MGHGDADRVVAGGDGGGGAGSAPRRHRRVPPAVPRAVRESKVTTLLYRYRKDENSMKVVLLTDVKSQGKKKLCLSAY